MLRPLAAAREASPAPLRLSLRPAAGGVDIGFVKRRGPQRDITLFLPLSTSTIVKYHVPFMDRPAPAPLAAGSLLSELVG
jgi:protein ImuA